MTSKIQAAKIVVRGGIPLVIGAGHKTTVLQRIVDGEDEGTLFVPQSIRLKGRKRWIAFFHKPKGTLKVDDGARKALRESGKSLLPPGIKECDGEFSSGDVVRVEDFNGNRVCPRHCPIQRQRDSEWDAGRTEVIHRDDLVICEETPTNPFPAHRCQCPDRPRNGAAKSMVTSR
jgi:glutamate 5-kinase